MAAHVDLNTKRKAFMLKAGDLVVLRTEGLSQPKAIIKLAACNDRNALGWSIWQFSVVLGSPDLLVFTSAPEDMIEVCVPVFDIPNITTTRELPFVHRPFHVYVEESAGANVYNIYKFSRKSLAAKVMRCARNFGLTSFIITNIHA